MSALENNGENALERGQIPELGETPPLVSLHYELGRTLGTGRSSTVKEAVCRKTRGTFAVKIIVSETHPTHDTEIVLAHEALVLRRVGHPNGHPNCVMLHRVIYCAQHSFLFMNKVPGGTVLERIQFSKGISEVDSVHTIVCVCKALQYLHGLGIVHRGVEPQNLLYLSGSTSATDANTVQLGGFHRATFTSPSAASTTSANFVMGDRQYVAPELIGRYKGPCGTEVDSWSVGVVLYHMLAGELPALEGKEGDEEKLDAVNLSFEEGRWAHLSASAKALISSLTNRDPKQRTTPAQCLEHRWVKTDAAISVSRLPPSSRAMILLREIASFQALGIKCLQDISEKLESVSVPSGQFVVRAGDAGEHVCFVCNGSVQLVNSSGEPGEIIAHGQFFGQKNVLEGNPHTADAKSLGAKKKSGDTTQDVVEVFKLAKPDLDALLAAYPAIKSSLLDAQHPPGLPHRSPSSRLLSSLSKRNLTASGDAPTSPGGTTGAPTTRDNPVTKACVVS